MSCPILNSEGYKNHEQPLPVAREVESLVGRQEKEAEFGEAASASGGENK